MASAGGGGIIAAASLASSSQWRYHISGSADSGMTTMAVTASFRCHSDIGGGITAAAAAEKSQ